VPKTFLVSQWRAAILEETDACHSEIGCYQGAHKDNPALRYMIYVLNSARFSLYIWRTTMKMRAYLGSDDEAYPVIQLTYDGDVARFLCTEYEQFMLREKVLHSPK